MTSDWRSTVTHCEANLTYFPSVAHLRSRSCLVICAGGRLFGIGRGGFFMAVAVIATMVVGRGEVGLALSKRNESLYR